MRCAFSACRGIVSSTDVEINELSVERVQILSRCIPGYGKYGANGYGHRMSLIDTFGDESEKRMPIENIIMPWLPAFNSLARGLAELRFRPASWDDYFRAINTMREIDETAEWRDRLKSGFELLGQQRYLWIADSLGLDGFDWESIEQ